MSFETPPPILNLLIEMDRLEHEIEMGIADINFCIQNIQSNTKDQKIKQYGNELVDIFEKREAIFDKRHEAKKLSSMEIFILDHQVEMINEIFKNIKKQNKIDSIVFFIDKLEKTWVLREDMMEELKNIKDNKLDKAIKETGEEYSASDWVTGWKKHKKNVGCDNFYTQWYRPKYDQGCRPKNEKYKYVLDE